MEHATVNKSKGIIALILALILVFGLSPAAFASEGGFSAETLTLQPGSDTGAININWYADTGTTDAKVRFTAGATVLTANADETPAAAETKVACKATVTGLTAGMTYTYEVSNDGGVNWSEDYTYTVPAQGAFSFAFVGDPQLKTGNQDANSAVAAALTTTIAQGWQDTITKIQALGVDFIASAGDQVDTTGGVEAEYTMFFAPDSLQSLPFAATVGNHDRNSGFLTHFNLPNEQNVSDTAGTSAAATAPTSLAGNYYYSYNNALFVVLNDSDYPASVDQAAPYIQAFHDTLEAAVSAYPDYEWLFIQHHKSTESVAQHAADKDIEYYVEAGIEDLMDEFHADFVLAGHDHVYARSYALYDGQRVSDDTSSLTNPAGSIYVTCNTGSGLKYYGIFSSTGLYVKNNATYPFLANGLTGSVEYLKGVYPLSTQVAVQNYIPGYTIIGVDGGEVTFTTYATYDDGNPDTSDVLDTFTVTKTDTAETRTEGFDNAAASLKAELAARYDSEVINSDGGSTEIVVYNSDNNCAYAVNGTTGHLVKIDMSGVTDSGTTVNGLTGVHIPVKEIMATYCPEFSYGDMTSVAVSTQADVIAVALQSSDYSANGMLALLTYDGTFIAAFDTGVQPDMVTFSADGLTALTADEGEPREGTEGTDPKGSVTILELDTADLENSTLNTVDFTAFDAQRQALVDAHVVLLKDTAPSTDLEPEYIAVSGDVAYICLQEANAIAVLDLNTKAFTGIYSLGLQNFGETAVDLLKDGGIDITTQDNVYGIKMPDGISVYTANGKTYLLTANEGDSRSDWYGLDNEFEDTTSPTGNVTMAQDVVWFDATQYDGLNYEVDKAYAFVFGGRSFSIYEVSDTGLTPVYDSGSDFEEVTAEYLADNFNCSNDKISLDNRSGKKGPEPENVTVGTVNGKTYAFIVLERIGGVMMYNITNPAYTSFSNYINSRDFSDKIVGDVSPEGMSFATINGIPTLLTANEVSGTVCAYTLEAKKVVSGGSATTTYTIAATAGEGGAITPSGSTGVSKNSNKTYTVTAETGYEISDVLVDGVSVGKVTTYTFENVTSNHTISASFEKIPETPWVNPFSDVQKSDWFYNYVQFVSENALMNGMGGGQFAPDAQMTRGMIVTILYRLDGSPAVAASSAFSDVTAGQWYTDAVIWATENSLTEGYGNGLFGVDDAVTREQTVSLLFRFASYKGYDTGKSASLASFGDGANTSDYAIDAMQWAVAAGIMEGDDGKLSPQGDSARGQIAAILQRFMENIVK